MRREQGLGEAKRDDQAFKNMKFKEIQGFQEIAPKNIDKYKKLKKLELRTARQQAAKLAKLAASEETDDKQPRSAAATPERSDDGGSSPQLSDVRPSEKHQPKAKAQGNRGTQIDHAKVERLDKIREAYN